MKVENPWLHFLFHNLELDATGLQRRPRGCNSILKFEIARHSSVSRDPLITCVLMKVENLHFLFHNLECGQWPRGCISFIRFEIGRHSI